MLHTFDAYAEAWAVPVPMPGPAPAEPAASIPMPVPAPPVVIEAASLDDLPFESTWPPLTAWWMLGGDGD